MATCAELLGVKLPASAGEDSVSLLPALSGAAETTRVIVHHSINGRFAVREGRWKLCLCPGSGGWGKPGDAEAAKAGLPQTQLYDLSTDSAETKNLSGQHPEVVAKLTQQLQTIIDEGRSTPGEKQANDVEIIVFKNNQAKAAKE